MDGSRTLTSLDKDNDNNTTNSRSDILSFTILSSRTHLRKRRANKISVQENLNTIKSITKKLAEFYRLTKFQDTAIRKCFQLLKKSFCTNIIARVRKKKSRQLLQTFDLLRDVRYLIELEEFLLCALALKPIQLYTITEKDATNFPYRLKR